MAIGRTLTHLMILGLSVLLLISSGVALVFAPYLPALILEGPPTLIWSGRGIYADVAGAQPVLDFRSGPSKHGMAPELAKLFEDSGGTALLVVHRGRLELEHYAPGDSSATQYNSFSMAKSLIGALIFRALAEGKLRSLDQTLGEFLPEASGLKTLSLRRVVRMRAGIHFDTVTSSFGSAGSVKDADTFPNPFGPLARLHFEGLGSVLTGLTMEDNPSEELTYQNVSTALLGAILEKVYDTPLETLLSEKIWAPAGAATAAWRKPRKGNSVSAYCCLYASARDWIRVGMFLEANGTPASPFLPQPLWREFLGLDVGYAERAVDHYGNHTFQNVLDRPGQSLQGPFTYFMGQDGQILYLMPDEDLVVYRAGERYQLLHSTLYGAWNSIYDGNVISR